MENSSRKKNSVIVLALDFPFQNLEGRKKLLAKAKAVLAAVYPYICAVKINHHLILPLGTFDGIQELIKSVHDEGLPVIVDCKANDIGSTNQVIAEYYYSAGFDALIANPFVGWEEGLKPIFDVAGKLHRGVILLAYMSHKGAKEGYGQMVCDTEAGMETAQYICFARKALKWKADGVVVGATYPEKIREISEILKKTVPVYSPGLGIQGGVSKSALRAGARYLIIGRAITLSQTPAEVAKELNVSINQNR